MNTVLFVNATIGFSENLFLVNNLKYSSVFPWVSPFILFPCFMSLLTLAFEQMEKIKNLFYVRQSNNLRCLNICCESQFIP